MARETKAEIAARLETEKLALEKKQKADAKKLEKLEAAKAAENKIVVVDFSQEVKELLRALVAALSMPTQQVISNPIKTQEKAPVKNVEAKQELFNEETNNPITTLTQIREMINAKVEGKKMAEVVSLLGEFGVKNAGSLAETNFDEFYNKLKNL